MTATGFSIYDTKAQAYLPPFFMATIGLGVRAFGDVLRDSSSPLSKHPRDYELYKVGEFDDSTGHLRMGAIQAPLLLVTGTQALEDNG